MWIDSHCHLNHENFLTPEGMQVEIESAKRAGVGGMLSVNCQIAREFPTLLALVKQYENIWCSIGTHPHDAALESERAIGLEDLIAKASQDDRIVAIGECGLDYYYTHSPKDSQDECFRKHIRACLATDLPIIIHARCADDDIIKILREENTEGKRLRGVMHCFSSTPKMGFEALDLGLYISFSGILTFKKSSELRNFAAEVPLDRILIETDSPFLAPEPFRGEMNRPMYVPHVGAKLAEIKNLDVSEVEYITTQNFFNLFTKAKQTWTQENKE